MSLKNFLRMNVCDGIQRDTSILFTSLCDNKCEHCVAKESLTKTSKRPNVDYLIEKVFSDPLDYEVLNIIGGEPCLFLEEMNEFIDKAKSRKPDIRIHFNTALPKTCFDNKKLFYEILDKCEFVMFSVQSHNESYADEIRGSKSTYDRQAFYKEIPDYLKKKIQISFLLTKKMTIKENVIDCVNYYGNLGYQSVRINEMIGHEYYNSFEDVMCLKKPLPSAFSHGCNYNVSKYFNSKSPVFVRRRCFIMEESQQASILDIIKVILVRIAKKFGYNNKLHRYTANFNEEG